LRRELAGHEVSTAHEMGWSQLENGKLLAAAEGAFEVLLTTDKNLRYQQSLQGRRLCVVVLPTTSWPMLRQHVGVIRSTLEGAQPGRLIEIELPD